MKGAILEHYQAKGQTLNSVTYSAALQDKLKPVICKKRRGLLPKLFFCRTTTLAPMLQLQQLRQFKTSSFRFCCIHLTPCDFHVVSPLKEALRRCRFGSDEELKEVVLKWIME
jgi:hypothetical protein